MENDYSSFFEDSCNEKVQEAFLMWVFRNGKEKQNDISKLSKELIARFCELNVDLDRISIVNCVNQYKCSEGSLLDLLITFRVDGITHKLAIEHKVKDEVNNPLEEYIKKVTNDNLLCHFVCLNVDSDKKEAHIYCKHFSDKNNRYYVFKLISSSYCIILEKYLDNKFVLDYYNHYFYEPFGSTSQLSRTGLKKITKYAFGHTFGGYDVKVEKNKITFSNTSIKNVVIAFHRWKSSGEYYLSFDDVTKKKVLNCDYFIGVDNAKKPRTRFCLKNTKKLEKAIDFKKVCAESMQIIENIM